MTRFFRQVLATFFGVLLCCAAGTAQPVSGAPAPDFALPDLQGKNLRLSEYRPDVVVLNFWAPWCNRCSNALAELNGLYQAHRAEGLQMLAIGVDFDHPETAEFLSTLQAEFPVLADDSRNSVSKAYELGTLPLTLVIDREGNVQYIHTGFDEETSQQIAAQVAALMAG